MEQKYHVLVGTTGSVAAIKIPELVKQLTELQEPKLEVELVATKAALHFFDPSQLPVKCHRDEDEWVWAEKGDPVVHIELRRWADLLVVAPLDANTMAKMASGICDNLLDPPPAWVHVGPAFPSSLDFGFSFTTSACNPDANMCLIRAWDPSRPLLYCPAMNTFMWEHPLTSTHTHTLTQLGYIQVPPVTKLLACGDQGMGAMAHVTDIVAAVAKHLTSSSQKQEASALHV